MARRTMPARLAPLVLPAVAVLACAEPVTAPPARDDMSAAARSDVPEVHLVYLVPSDQEVNRSYVRVLRAAARNLQLWYQQELATGETFTLAKPTVDVVRLEQEASWYATTANGEVESRWFWFNVTDEAFALTGGSFGDPDDVWIYYIDAAPACDQETGAAAGVALMPRNDLLGLAGETTIDTCTGEAEPDQGTCRWVGGLGHELGHALGLPHPPGCESGDPNCAGSSIMWLGYLSYPDAILTPAEQTALGDSPFITPVRITGEVPTCDALGGRAPVLTSVTTGTQWLMNRVAEQRVPACAFGILARSAVGR